MKKILSILMLLVAIVTGAKATELVERYQYPGNDAVDNGYFTKFTLGEGAAYNSRRIKVSNGETGTFTVSTNANVSALKIKTIELKEYSSNKISALTVNDVALTKTDGKYTYTAGSNETSVTFTMSASGGNGEISEVAITLTDGNNDDSESLIPVSGSQGAIVWNSTLSPSLATITGSTSNVKFATSNGTSVIEFKQNDVLTVSATRAIKAVYFSYTANMPSLTVPAGTTYNATTHCWTPANTNTKSVSFTKSSGSTTRISNIYIVYQTEGPSLSVDPPTANAFTYIVDNGPSAAQEFTVSLANSTKAVSATLSSSNYEMSKTGEADSYTSEAFTDLTNGSKVYVRLKAGLAKADDYNGTLTFANADVEDDVVINLSGSVTGQTYTVTYDLNGGSGDAPTQDPVEAGTQITLPAAASKDFYTFAGWLCDADNVVYDAEALYPMTATPTTFTAQWTGPSYSSTLDFAAKTLAGETSGTLAEFLATGNMICSGIATRSGWETQTTDKKVGFWGYKLKDINATVKFMVQAGKRVTITLGSIGATTTLKKNGVSESVSTNSGDYKQNVITFDAGVDMLVEIVVGEDNKTVTLNKIAIEDAIAATNVTVGSTGFATIGLPYATTLPEGVTAYAVSSVTDSKVNMSEAIAAGTVIPANRGLVIMADPANSPYAFAEFVGTQQFDLSGNELKAVGATAKEATTTEPIYILAITDATNKKVGFKKSTSGSLGAYKAYLPGTVATTNSLSMDFDDATAINNVNANDNANSAAPVKVVKNGKLFIGNYNVAGQQVK